MKEVCEVSLKKVTSLGHEMFLVISRFRKCLVMSTSKPDKFMQLF